MRLTLLGEPRTKKNSQRIIQVHGRPMILPSKEYKDYEAACLRQIPEALRTRAETPVNVACVYYMRTRRRCDLANLIEASTDMLVRAGVLADDNSRIIVSHDGCRVRYDRDNPRVEIEITEAACDTMCVI